jgi:hypothetical protein
LAVYREAGHGAADKATITERVSLPVDRRNVAGWRQIERGNDVDVLPVLHEAFCDPRRLSVILQHRGQRASGRHDAEPGGRVVRIGDELLLDAPRRRLPRPEGRRPENRIEAESIEEFALGCPIHRVREE